VKKHKINIDEIKKAKRDPISTTEFESAMRQIMAHSSKPKKKSENREPTREEISRRWKLSR